MHRLHDDDLCGSLLKNNHDWVVLSFPAIALKDEQIPLGDGQFYDRHTGDVLHPERESKSDLDKIRSDLGEDVFGPQYQQCPSQPAGQMIKRDSIQRYDRLPIRKKSHYVIQSWDTAIKVDATNDCSACATLLVDDKRNYYLVEVLRDRLLYPDLKAQAIAQAKKHRPDVILIEEAGLLGRTLIKDFKAAGFKAIGVIPEGDKLTRVSVQLEKFANRQVFFPREAPWLVDLETKFSLFLTGPTMTRLMLSCKPSPTSAQPLYGTTPHLGVWTISTPGLFCHDWVKTPEIAVNLPSIACFALRNSLFHGE